MFTIIISEKGGAERRETFDRNEINVGRVQGNDLMLPKGNVSKHHARLLYRDGRFIVTDLKSTNGTYVNGRKISQATIVREGDKIYIGDFVLRLETGAVPLASVEGGEAQPRSDAREAGVLSPPQHAVHLGGPPSPGAVIAAAPSSAAAQQRSAESSGVSHFPLEREPENESAPDPQASQVPRVPVPPRPPQVDGRLRPSAATMAMPSPASTPRAALGPTSQQAARLKALVALVDRIGEAVDLGGLKNSPVVDEPLSQRIKAAAAEQSRAMRAEAPDDVDLDVLAEDAIGELLALGPIGALLDDDQVEEVFVPRAGLVIAMGGGPAGLVAAGFTSEEALARVVARLAFQAGEPLRPGEAIIDRRLKRGAQMIAIAPPVSTAWTLTIRKQLREEVSIDDLIRAGVLSRSMAALLERCIFARANVLVVGSGAGLVSPTIAALAFASGPGERIAVLADSDDIRVPHAHVTRLAVGDRGARVEEVLSAAARLRPDRLVLASLAGRATGAAMDAIGDGTEGVVAGFAAPSLRHGLGRLAAHVALSRPGSSIESARAAVAECFEVAVEITRSTDGFARITRIAELAGADASGVVANDLFVRSTDGTGEGGYVATGTTPRFAKEFATRGVQIDPALFRRRQ